MHKKGRPLLYVNQPEFPEIKPVMQHYYQAPSTHEKTPVKKSKVPPLGYVEETFIEKTSYEKEPEKKAEKEKEPKKETFTFKELKPFKKMTLHEKIDYLSAFEGRRAPFQCRFMKEDGSELHGVISKQDRHELTIKTLKGEEVSISRDELGEIHIY
ncbi:CotO family spore coat protein [Jeotgalibacillus haloalkalitolerans]|uniref:CotO family spore coat protein n=1 Tax=Jeotgalibacillus haloalkalitolerans TaxID=3104292 RepID=A0ABU5KP01_9BACL|nr:CotO family spore coat protein [Jeotgalibacillus sp. HH7-29]MDZ5712989.1 CotO family spore coat protein [Jeotgalibacillus sp. HH7-29]